jgi:hypothetical protein
MSLRLLSHSGSQLDEVHLVSGVRSQESGVRSQESGVSKPGDEGCT